jgi:hypothetical protein
MMGYQKITGISYAEINSFRERVQGYGYPGNRHVGIANLKAAIVPCFRFLIRKYSAYYTYDFGEGWSAQSRLTTIP